MNSSASLVLRVVSKCIDFVIVFAAAEALPKAGWLAGLGYVLIADGLFNGQSIGKKLTGLRVLTSTGAPCTIKESILRNSTLGVGFLLWKLPYIGWILLLAVTALEFIILMGSRQSMRLGDEFAGTSVVEQSADKQPDDQQIESEEGK